MKLLKVWHIFYMNSIVYYFLYALKAIFLRLKCKYKRQFLTHIFPFNVTEINWTHTQITTDYTKSIHEPLEIKGCFNILNSYVICSIIRYTINGFHAMEWPHEELLLQQQAFHCLYFESWFTNDFNIDRNYKFINIKRVLSLKKMRLKYTPVLLFIHSRETKSLFTD